MTFQEVTLQLRQCSCLFSIRPSLSNSLVKPEPKEPKMKKLAIALCALVLTSTSAFADELFNDPLKCTAKISGQADSKLTVLANGNTETANVVLVSLNEAGDVKTVLAGSNNLAVTKEGVNISFDAKKAKAIKVKMLIVPNQQGRQFKGTISIEENGSIASGSVDCQQ